MGLPIQCHVTKIALQARMSVLDILFSKPLSLEDKKVLKCRKKAPSEFVMRPGTPMDNIPCTTSREGAALYYL